MLLLKVHINIALKKYETNVGNAAKKKNKIRKKNLETVILGFLAEIYVGHLNEEISYYNYILC